MIQIWNFFQIATLLCRPSLLSLQSIEESWRCPRGEGDLEDVLEHLLESTFSNGGLTEAKPLEDILRDIFSSLPFQFEDIFTIFSSPLLRPLERQTPMSVKEK